MPDVFPPKLNLHDVLNAARAVIADQSNATRILATCGVEMLERGRSDLALLCLRALAFGEMPTDPDEVDRVRH